MDELIARVQEQLDRIADLGDAMNGCSGRATASDGSMTVEVDGNGALTGLHFTDGIGKLTPAEFEKTLIETARMAVQEAFTARGELINAFNAECGGQ